MNKSAILALSKLQLVCLLEGGGSLTKPGCHKLYQNKLIVTKIYERHWIVKNHITFSKLHGILKIITIELLASDSS